MPGVSLGEKEDFLRRIIPLALDEAVDILAYVNDLFHPHGLRPL